MFARILELVEMWAKEGIAREGFRPVDVAVRMLKVAPLLALCFSTEVSHVTRELSEKEPLRRSWGYKPFQMQKSGLLVLEPVHSG